MLAPWTEGPQELLQHAVDHLGEDKGFDNRIAMVSIDNAVELSIKTFLALPKRTRNGSGPSRKQLQEAGDSFPALLDLLQQYASNRIVGMSLDEIEWYHRIRNQLYHSGNGITVEKSKVETYLRLALILFESLFEFPLKLSSDNTLRSKVGEFLENWVQFERQLRRILPEKNGYAYYLKRGFLKQLSSEVENDYSIVAKFRNEIIHGDRQVSIIEFEKNIKKIKQLNIIVQKI